MGRAGGMEWACVRRSSHGVCRLALQLASVAADVSARAPRAPASALVMADVRLSPPDLVESATHELLNGQPDWSANMTIVDLINQQPHMYVLRTDSPQLSLGMGLQRMLQAVPRCSLAMSV